MMKDNSSIFYLDGLTFCEFVERWNEVVVRNNRQPHEHVDRHQDVDDQASLQSAYRNKWFQWCSYFIILYLTFCLVDFPINAWGNCSTAGVTHFMKELVSSSTAVSLAVALEGVSRIVPFSVKSKVRPTVSER